jgi:hypothetical protein
MKKITCIQQYVIDKLIDDEKLSTGNLIDAMSKVCSKEQFDNILSILIETPKLEYKEDLEKVGMSMFISSKVSSDTKMRIMKILKDQFSLGIKQTKEYVDSCIGRYNILPKAVKQEEINKFISRLGPNDSDIISVSTTSSY